MLFTGLSVTKAFVLLSGVTNAPIKASPEERVTYGIKATGVPTTFASASIFIALLVCGLVSDLQVLKHFCWFTGTVLLGRMNLNILIFYAFLSFTLTETYLCS